MASHWCAAAASAAASGEPDATLAGRHASRSALTNGPQPPHTEWPAAAARDFYFPTSFH